jgi:hypothetical protein
LRLERLRAERLLWVAAKARARLRVKANEGILLELGAFRVVSYSRRFHWYKTNVCEKKDGLRRTISLSSTLQSEIFLNKVFVLQ